LRITSATPLVLGSASPRRRELLDMLGVAFIVRAATIDETAYSSEPPDAYLARITSAKTAAVRRHAGTGADALVLVADTIVVSPAGVILGKPAGDEEAESMIEQLAGTTHEVKTRFELSRAAGAQAAHAETVTTRVTFRPLASGEGRAYARTGEGRDKAGGYAVQGKAGSFVERIDGSYTNVVGLPLSEVVVALRTLGVW
jgi:septum formation protein